MSVNGLNALASEIHENAVAHGWWDEARSFGDIISLIHSELSEALEEYRDGHPNTWFACLEGDGELPCGPKDSSDCLNFGQEETCRYRSKKPEGIGIELADAIIRTLDYCAYAGIDIEEAIRVKHEYNKTRPWKHGGKKC